ncbi:hypothetical protein Srufu_066350 [Streptomyces libani subsp. rufus]|nr:hypothetical protein Srufu_066350 [Streptomyces libani subsp. rufus]
MAARDTGCDRPRPVQHLRPGDHAFVRYGDDEVRWEVVTAFVRLGPARGEKVLVPPSPGVPEDEVLARIDFPSRNTVRARERGQLVVSSMREVMLAALQRAHPCTLLERLGGLRSTRGPDGALCFIGEADAAHRTAVGRALELAPAQTAAAGRLTVDPTRLHFLSVGCAVSLLILARDAAGQERIEVHCDRGQRWLLRRLGAGTVSRLVLTEVVRAW